jgi:AcrR family transcriptional regulator
MNIGKQAMLKPGGRNPQQTQQRILEAALQEFAAKGFAGARVDVIARRARINKRMLYHYFGDKEGLFREVLRRKISERAAWLASAPEEPAERLPFWFQLACRDREWVQLLEWEALQWGEKKVIDEERRQESVGKALERVRQQQGRGLLNPDLDPGQLLLSMMALTAYPVAFPQLARLTTGLSISDEKFQKQRETFLRQIALLLQGKKPGPNTL